MSAILALKPTTYYPSDSGHGFYDDVTNIPATIFKDPGVKCSCGSKTIFKNKYSFTHVHLKSKQHQTYILNWNKRGSENLIETCISLKKETRLQNITIAERDKTIRTLKKQKQILVPENTRLTEELEAIKSQFEEMFVQIQKENKGLNKENTSLKMEVESLKKKVIELNDANKKAEVLAKQILISLGYDFEC